MKRDDHKRRGSLGVSWTRSGLQSSLGWERVINSQLRGLKAFMESDAPAIRSGTAAAPKNRLPRSGLVGPEHDFCVDQRARQRCLGGHVASPDFFLATNQCSRFARIAPATTAHFHLPLVCRSLPRWPGSPSFVRA